VQQAARSARGRGELRDCGYLLRDRGASLALNAAYSVKTLAAVPNPDVVSAKSARERRFGNSKKRSKNRPLPKVIPYATRSSLRVANSPTEPNDQRKFASLWLRQTAEMRCDEAARCRERLGKTRNRYLQDAA